MRYPLEQLYEEVAVLAYYFHWSRQEILELEHAERVRFIEQISKLQGTSAPPAYHF